MQPDTIVYHGYPGGRPKWHFDRVRAGTCRSDYLIAWALVTLGEPL